MVIGFQVSDFGILKKSEIPIHLLWQGTDSKFKYQMLKSITPPQADGACKGIILSLPPHPTPLPRERELAETPPQADGVLKTLIKFAFSLFLIVLFNIRRSLHG